MVAGKRTFRTRGQGHVMQQVLLQQDMEEGKTACQVGKARGLHEVLGVYGTERKVARSSRCPTATGQQAEGEPIGTATSPPRGMAESS